MRLKRLTLTNFHGFADLDLTFSERTTVLVGINGAGKTSILEALTVILEQIRSKEGQKTFFSCEPTDLRSGHQEGQIHLEAAFESDELHGSWDLGLFLDATAPNTVLHDLITLSVPSPANYPALEYYPVDRMVRSDPPPVDETHDSNFQVRRHGFDYASFFHWYEEREDLENETIREQPEFRDLELEAVRRAIHVLLPGFSNLRVRRSRVRKDAPTQPSRLVVTKGNQLLELAQLSHGERGLLAMTGDIAHRLAMIGPETSEPHLRSAIVMIDEIDLHLHPRWQRDVLPRLEMAFPNTQFIVTTHSPQVLAQLKPENIKLLQDFRLVPTPPTFGRDSNAILSEVMGLDEFPTFSDEWRHRISEHIDRGRWPEARAELKHMKKHFGEQDREVLRFQTVIDMLDDSREAAK